jgi:2-phospho-L-lactate guanylyltransferase
VDRISSQLSRRGVGTVLRLPAGLPLIQPADIEGLLEASSQCAALLVPSLDFTGTNALLRSPPDLFPSRFGQNSLALHLREALQTGASLQIHQNDRIACDLDQPSDIAWFLENTTSNQTLSFLEEIRIRERLSQYALS